MYVTNNRRMYCLRKLQGHVPWDVYVRVPLWSLLDEFARIMRSHAIFMNFMRGNTIWMAECKEEGLRRLNKSSSAGRLLEEDDEGEEREKGRGNGPLATPWTGE